MPSPTPIAERLSREILVLGGAMGTMIMPLPLSEKDFRNSDFENYPGKLKGCYDLLNLTRPDLISDIHKRYLEAGADIITTNTFNANPVSLAQYGLSKESGHISFEGVRLARKSVDDFIGLHQVSPESQPYVAGTIGPTGISLSRTLREGRDISGEFVNLAEAIKTQTSALMKGGADLLLLETIFDLESFRSAIYGILHAFEQQGRDIPLIISATLTENGTLPSGHSLPEFAEIANELSPLAVGLNCGFGAKSLARYIPQLKQLTDSFISFHPNAGIPDSNGVYRDTPEIMEAGMKPLISTGAVNIIGGCCGTTPEYITRFSKLACNKESRFRNIKSPD